MEIREKEKQLSQLPPAPTHTVTLDQEIQNLILRFIVFGLLTGFWGAMAYVGDRMSDTLSISFQIGRQSETVMTIGLIVAALLRFCLVATVLTLGLPLFVDVNKYVKINLGYLLRPFSSRNKDRNS